MTRMTGCCARESAEDKQRREENRNEKGELFYGFIATRRVLFLSTLRSPGSHPAFMALYFLAMTPITPSCLQAAEQRGGVRGSRLL